MGDMYDDPGEMTDEDLLALAGLGGDYGDLDTTPPGGDGLLQPSSTSLDWMKESDPSSWMAPESPASMDFSDYNDPWAAFFAEGSGNDPNGGWSTDVGGTYDGEVGRGKVNLAEAPGLGSKEPGVVDGQKGRFNPSTGVWETEKPWYQKLLEGFWGPEDGKQAARQPASPASSMSGMASNAAAKAAEARAAESRILLEQDRNRIQAEQLKLMREKYLRNQKATSRLRTLDRPYNSATPGERAEAQKDLATYDPFGAIPENTLPKSSWWEKFLAGYGTAAGMASGARSGNF